LKPQEDENKYSYEMKLAYAKMMEAIYKVIQKQFLVNIRMGTDANNFCQVNFTYPPSDRVSEDRRKRRELAKRHVAASSKSKVSDNSKGKKELLV